MWCIYEILTEWCLHELTETVSLMFQFHLKYTQMYHKSRKVRNNMAFVELVIWGNFTTSGNKGRYVDVMVLVTFYILLVHRYLGLHDIISW